MTAKEEGFLKLDFDVRRIQSAQLSRAEKLHKTYLLLRVISRTKELQFVFAFIYARQTILYYPAKYLLFTLCQYKLYSLLENYTKVFFHTSIGDSITNLWDISNTYQCTSKNSYPSYTYRNPPPFTFVLYLNITLFYFLCISTYLPLYFHILIFYSLLKLLYTTPLILLLCTNTLLCLISLISLVPRPHPLTRGARGRGTRLKPHLGWLCTCTSET